MSNTSAVATTTPLRKLRRPTQNEIEAFFQGIITERHDTLVDVQKARESKKNIAQYVTARSRQRFTEWNLRAEREGYYPVPDAKGAMSASWALTCFAIGFVFAALIFGGAA